MTKTETNFGFIWPSGKAFATALLLGALVQSIVAAQGQLWPQANDFTLPSSTYAIQTVRQLHSAESPIIVQQDELNQLIDAEGGGACPIAAGLIAAQTLRSMAGLPLEQHPHRLALQLFQDRPELKQGRITNERFVELLHALAATIQGCEIGIQVESAENCSHTSDGPYWSSISGPDLSINSGEVKILSYTVTRMTTDVLGRHFVLLRNINGRQIRVLDPSRPLKDYQYKIQVEGNQAEPNKRVFLKNAVLRNDRELTYELNTVFTVRLDARGVDRCGTHSQTVDQIKTRIDALAHELEEEGKLTSPKEWRRRGATFGLPGLDIPKRLGGSGWKAEQMLEIFRHAGRYNLNLRDVVGGAHGRPATKMNSEFGKQAVRSLIGGNAYVAVAITEESAGTQARSMQSQAVVDGDGFRLRGTKLWNARLRQATHVLLYTRAANGKPGKLTAFLLPIDHPGLGISDRYAHGLTGNSFGGLEFEDMYVGSEHLVGNDGDGGRLFEEHFLYWRLMQAAAAIGCGERALELMAERIRTRNVFGGPIGRFTHLQQPLGEQLTKLRMALALGREAARLFDRGDYDAAEPLVNGIKAEGVEFALAACDAAMRAHGALGYSRETDVGDRVRDLMGLRIADGTTDVMRMLVVREAYGYDLWHMSIEGGSTTESMEQ